MSQFLMLSGSFKTEKWKRFNRYILTDYYYMKSEDYDAITLKPEVDIYLLGFAMMNTYTKIPWTCIFKVVIND